MANSTVHVFLQEVNDEPALILARRAYGKGCAFVIGLSSAYKYLDDDYLVEMSHKAAEALLIHNPTSGEIRGIADAIMNGIDGLVALPPRADEEKPVVGEGIVTVNGKSFEFDVHG